jgi:hypothetical protein
LPSRPLFIEPVDPLNVERRRYADAANDVVKEDAGVLEEPGQKDDGEGNAHQAGVGGQWQVREDENQERGCAARWAEEVGDETDASAAGILSAVSLLKAVRMILSGYDQMPPGDLQITANRLEIRSRDAS